MNKRTVKEIRKSRAWSQAHLAEASGVSIRTVQRLEREGKASYDTLLAIAAALDVEVESLTSLVLRPQTSKKGEIRPLWKEISPRQAVLWGGVLLVPTFLFIACNYLKYEMDLPQLYDLLVSVGASTGLAGLTDFFTSPMLLLGAPIIAVLISVMAQINISGEDTTQGFSMKEMTVSFNLLSSAVLVCALAGLGALLGYATMENLSDWVIELLQ